MLDAVWVSQSCEIKLRRANDLEMSRKKRVFSQRKKQHGENHENALFFGYARTNCVCFWL